MKTRLLLTLVICLFGVLLFGQHNNTLRGKVLYLSSGKKPAVGVKVSGKIDVLEYANDVYSANNGDYLLVFPNARDGYGVELTIGKTDCDGYQIELVNIKEIEQCKIPALKSDQFEIIVCRKGFRDLKALSYYNILKSSSEKEIEKLKNEVQILLKEQKQDFNKISILSKKIYKYENDSVSIYRDALRLASINKDNCSARSLKLIEMLKSGASIIEVREVLNVDSIGCDINQEKAEHKVKINRYLDEYDRRASLSLRIFDYEDIVFSYENALKYTDNPNRIINYHTKISEALNTLENHKKALIHNKKALSIGKENSEIAQDITVLYNNTALTYTYLELYDKALEYCSSAIQLQDSLLVQNTESLSTSYNICAKIHKELGEYDKSLLFSKKALVIQEENLHMLHPDLATSYNNIALIYTLLEQYELALEYFNYSIDISDGLDPFSLSITYSNIAGIYCDLNKLEEALLYDKKAILIQEEILPKQHPNLAISYNNIAETYSLLYQHELSLKYNLKALSIERKKNEGNSAALVGLYSKISVDYTNIGLYDKAMESMMEADEIANAIEPTNTELLQMVFYYSWQIIKTKAIDAYLKRNYKQALENFLIFAENIDDSEVWMYIGLCRYHLQAYKTAIEAYEIALRIDPKNIQNYYNNIGDAYACNHQLRKACAAFTLYEEISIDNCEVFKNWAIYYALKNDSIKSIDYIQKYLESDCTDHKWLTIDSSLDNIKSNERFIDIIKTLNR
jgi:tetratricopeptide (TPR) repeat protein